MFLTKFLIAISGRASKFESAADSSAVSRNASETIAGDAISDRKTSSSSFSGPLAAIESALRGN